MKYAMSDRMSERNVWTILSKLIDDLQSHLPPEDVRILKTIVRKRDLLSLRGIGPLLCAQRITESDGDSVWNSRLRYQLGALLRKFQFPGSAEERRKNALSGFLGSEARCQQFNTDGYRDLTWSDSDFRQALLTYAREFILRVLGDELPDFSELTRRARHGPGSTFIASSSGKVTTYYKYADWPYTVTRDAFPYAVTLIESDERWIGALQDSYRRRKGLPMHALINRKAFFEEVLTVVEGNRICFVPKDSQKDRPIAIEPSMNVMLQLGVDGVIRSRLKRWGVDLDDQSKNQDLARLGSVDEGDNSPSTIDLSAASDSVSLRLCEILLPQSWYTYLLSLRCASGTVDGVESPIVYEKISSMGNGFTFALESLIFSAIVYGSFKANGHDWDRDMIAVFGDDIVVPKHLALCVIEGLSVCGFSLNLDKSFVIGPFKESCGTDWLQGNNIRPVFFSEMPNHVDELYHWHNSLALWLRRTFEAWHQEWECLRYIIDLIPKELRLFGPLTENTNTHLFHFSYPSHKGTVRWKEVRRHPRMWFPKEFLLRKLMHDLTPLPDVSPYHNWKDPHIVGRSSRFDVTRRDAWDFAIRSNQKPSWLLDQTATELGF